MNYSFKEFSGKTVLVTGATGFTGRVLTEKLIKAGAKVNAIARHSSELGDLAKHEIAHRHEGCIQGLLAGRKLPFRIRLDSLFVNPLVGRRHNKKSQEKRQAD